MKRIIFCFDGTWNKLDAANPTNVVYTAQSIVPLTKDNVVQIIHYDEGVGTNKRERLRGGLFGKGLLQNLSEAYRFLIFNYDIGDEIYVFGFSRGAYSARSFVGLIRNCGILTRPNAGRASQAIKMYKSRAEQDHPNSEKMNDFRFKYCQPVCVSEKEDQWKHENIDGYNPGDHPFFKIKFLGVWDTVGSLGVPSNFPGSLWINWKYQFHDTILTYFVESARHAVAIDEKRNSFAPSLWSNIDALNKKVGKSSADYDAPYQQKWFPGTHGSVGGGGIRRGLSDQAMDWVLDGVRKAGLELDSSPTSVIFSLKPDYREYLENYIPPPPSALKDWAVCRFMQKLPKSDRMPGPKHLYEVSISAQRRWKENPENLKDGVSYRPRTLEQVSDQLDQVKQVKMSSFEDGQYNVHIVGQGESLSSIAKQYYKDAEEWQKIYKINSYKIDDPNRIYVGMSLFIPVTAI